MYIKLTRLDSTPIWFNAAFVVTVEPRKGGGSIVVPIGDGLDYEVREKTDDVLALLDGAPVATVVPVPPPKGLSPTPEDVSPETEPPEEVPPPQVAALAEPARTESAPDVPPADAPKPGRRTRRTKKAEADGDAPKPARKSRAKAKKPEVDFPEEQVERLRKMMPGSLRKLLNTLATQFRVENADAVVGLLKDRGVIDVDREHVVWTKA